MMRRRSFLARLGAGIGAGSGLALLPGAGRAQVAGGFLDGRLYGLVPDSTSDQSDLLQNALDDAARLGFALVIGAGRYMVQEVRVPSGCRMVGVPGASILVAPGSASVLVASEQNSLTIEGLGFEQQSPTERREDAHLIYLEACTNVTIADCAFRRFEGNGVWLERCSGRVRDCDFSGLGFVGLHVQDSSAVLISGNRFTGMGNGGIRVWRYENGRDGSIVTANTVSDVKSDWGDGQNGNGINIFQADEVVVADNTITGCALSAIRANSTNNTIIRGNQCTDSSEVAIFSEFAFSGSIISGNLVDGAATGISMTNFDDGGRLAVCSDNIVRNILPFSPTNPDTRPVGILAEADSAIAGNVVEKVPGIGIAAGWGPFLRDVMVTNNLVRDVDIGIGVSVADGAGNARISGNQISGARRSALGAMEWEKLVSVDLIRDAGRYPQLSVSNNSDG